MPVFKALVSITVWVLFICGWGGVIGSAVYKILTGSPRAPFIWIIGITCFFLSSVVVWIRKKLEE